MTTEYNLSRQKYFSGVIPATLTAALGGLLFGYDTAVISGAIGYIQSYFKLNAALTGWAASSALLGCVFGAMFAGLTGDRLGRKKTLIICSVLFTISAICTAIPQTFTQFVIGRFIGGLGIGGASMLSPMYIAEISPEKIRGRLVALYQLAIVLGILLVFFVNMLIQAQGDELWNTNTGWRWMFGSGIFPAILFGVLLFIIPESPRWLMKEGRTNQALNVLIKLTGPVHAAAELKQIEKSLQVEDGKITELFTGGFRRALIVGVCLAFFQQTCGINVVMYFAPEIFKDIGSSVDGAFLSAVYIGAINMVFTFVAIWLVDKIGRKILLIAGTLLQGITLAAAGILFHINGSPLVLLAVMLVYIAAFAAAMGPIVWIIIAEIFPNKIRGQAMSIATFVLWTTCFLVTQFYPVLREKIGNAPTFWFYSASSFAAMLFVIFFVPETKNRTLEEIEQSWLTSA